MKRITRKELRLILREFLQIDDPPAGIDMPDLGGGPGKRKELMIYNSRDSLMTEQAPLIILTIVGGEIVDTHPTGYNAFDDLMRATDMPMLAQSIEMMLIKKASVNTNIVHVASDGEIPEHAYLPFQEFVKLHSNSY